MQGNWGRGRESPFLRVITVLKTLMVWQDRLIWRKLQELITAINKVILNMAYLLSSFAQSCLTLTLWTAARQASLFITNSQSLLKLMSIKSVMPSNHLILCCPLFLLLPIFPRNRVFSNESVLSIRWSKYWSFSFTISPSNEYSGLISLWQKVKKS